MVEELLRQPGIDINVLDNDGECALHSASFNDNHEAMELLLASAQRVEFFNIASGRVRHWTKYWVAGRVRVG